MTVPVRAAWWIYFALIIAALLLPVMCSAEDGKTEIYPAQDAPTIIDWEKHTITMSLELWKGIMERMSAQDEYIKSDRGRLKQEIINEEEKKKKTCI